MENLNIYKSREKSLMNCRVHITQNQLQQLSALGLSCLVFTQPALPTEDYLSKSQTSCYVIYKYTRVSKSSFTVLTTVRETQFTFVL